MIQLFRVVSQSEYEDILRIGGFRFVINALEAKQFCLSLQEADQFAEAIREINNISTTIISLEVEQNVFEQFELHMNIDVRLFPSGVVTIQRDKIELLNKEYRNLTKL